MSEVKKKRAASAENSPALEHVGFHNSEQTLTQLLKKRKERDDLTEMIKELVGKERSSAEKDLSALSTKIAALEQRIVDARKTSAGAGLEIARSVGHFDSVGVKSKSSKSGLDVSVSEKSSKKRKDFDIESRKAKSDRADRTGKMKVEPPSKDESNDELRRIERELAGEDKRSSSRRDSERSKRRSENADGGGKEKRRSATMSSMDLSSVLNKAAQQGTGSLVPVSEDKDKDKKASKSERKRSGTEKDRSAHRGESEPHLLTREGSVPALKRGTASGTHITKEGEDDAKKVSRSHSNNRRAGDRDEERDRERGRSNTRELNVSSRGRRDRSRERKREASRERKKNSDASKLRRDSGSPTGRTAMPPVSPRSRSSKETSGRFDGLSEHNSLKRIEKTDSRDTIGSEDTDVSTIEVSISVLGSQPFPLTLPEYGSLCPADLVHLLRQERDKTQLPPLPEKLLLLHDRGDGSELTPLFPYKPLCDNGLSTASLLMLRASPDSLTDRKEEVETEAKDDPKSIRSRISTFLKRREASTESLKSLAREVSFRHSTHADSLRSDPSSRREVISVVEIPEIGARPIYSFLPHHKVSEGIKKLCEELDLPQAAFALFGKPLEEEADRELPGNSTFEELSSTFSLSTLTLRRTRERSNSAGMLIGSNTSSFVDSDSALTTSVKQEIDLLVAGLRGEPKPDSLQRSTDLVPPQQQKDPYGDFYIHNIPEPKAGSPGSRRRNFRRSGSFPAIAFDAVKDDSKGLSESGRRLLSPKSKIERAEPRDSEDEKPKRLMRSTTGGGAAFRLRNDSVASLKQTLSGRWIVDYEVLERDDSSSAITTGDSSAADAGTSDQSKQQQPAASEVDATSKDRPESTATSGPTAAKTSSDTSATSLADAAPGDAAASTAASRQSGASAHRVCSVCKSNKATHRARYSTSQPFFLVCKTCLDALPKRGRAQRQNQRVAAQLSAAQQSEAKEVTTESKNSAGDEEKSASDSNSKSLSKSGSVPKDLQRAAARGDSGRRLNSDTSRRKKSDDNLIVSGNDELRESARSRSPHSHTLSKENSSTQVTASSYTIASFAGNRMPVLDVAADEIVLCELLGTGGSCTTVYRAVARGFSFAVKVFDTTFVDSEMIDSIKREIELLSRCRHDNIVQYMWHYELPTPDRKPEVYLCMEYLMKTLHEVIKERRDASLNFSAEELLTFLKDIAQALRFLHYGLDQPVIHRDLKSENVFVMDLCRDGKIRLKLGDLGEAVYGARATFFRKARNQTTSFNAGTEEFRAPELWAASGEAAVGAYNEKVDIWSYGMLIFELLTLDLPYRLDKLSRWDIPLYISRGVRPALPWSDEGPEDLQSYISLFRRCTEKDANLRPSAKDLVSILGKIENIRRSSQ